MKIIFSIFLCSFFLCSCADHGKPAEQLAAKDTLEKQKFFPVTDYLEGEVYNIKKSGVNPLMYTTVNGHTDSVWIKIEELDSIDSILREGLTSNEYQWVRSSLKIIMRTRKTLGTADRDTKLPHLQLGA